MSRACLLRDEKYPNATMCRVFECADERSRLRRTTCFCHLPPTPSVSCRLLSFSSISRNEIIKIFKIALILNYHFEPLSLSLHFLPFRFYYFFSHLCLLFCLFSHLRSGLVNAFGDLLFNAWMRLKPKQNPKKDAMKIKQQTKIGNSDVFVLVKYAIRALRPGSVWNIFIFLFWSDLMFRACWMKIEKKPHLKWMVLH